MLLFKSANKSTAVTWKPSRRTMVMFQERICVKSFIRYCHDNKLFRSTWSFCHIDTICWWPASRLGDAREQQELVQKKK